MAKRFAILGDTLVTGEIYGIQRFAYEILRQIDIINPPMDIMLVVPRHVIIKNSFKNIKIVKYGGIKNPFLWRQLCFPSFAKTNDCISVDMTLGLPFHSCKIVCLHDCIYENYSPDFVSIKEKIKRLSYLIRAKRSVKKSDKIITVSNYSKRELINYYGVSDNKIEVVYNSWQHFERITPNYSVLAKFKLSPKGYYFSLGSGLRHKNILWVVNCAINNPGLQFVITGSDKFSGYLSSLGLVDIPNILYTGYLPDEDVKALMECCTAFIHPAFYEGFGIPPMEALSCGANIIVSNSSCLPEIYGNSAVYINPHDDKVDMRYIDDFPDVEEKEKVLKKYSWQKSAEEFIKIMEMI